MFLLIIKTLTKVPVRMCRIVSTAGGQSGVNQLTSDLMECGQLSVVLCLSSLICGLHSLPNQQSTSQIANINEVIWCHDAADMA